MKALLHLYPAAWRKRYGEELETLLQDASPKWHDYFDVLKGALQMRLKHPSAALAAALILTGAAAGALTSYLRPQRWEATSTVKVVRFNPTDDGAALRTIVRSSLDQVADPHLTVSEQPRFEPNSQAILFSLTSTANDPARAVADADAAAHTLARKVGRGFTVRFRMPHPMRPLTETDRNDGGGIRDNYQAFVTPHPSVAAIPISPGAATFLAAGLGGGLLLALAALVVQRHARVNPA